jgi:uncharacterized protein with gpF-like domain
MIRSQKIATSARIVANLERGMIAEVAAVIRKAGADFAGKIAAGHSWDVSAAHHGRALGSIIKRRAKIAAIAGARTVTNQKSVMTLFERKARVQPANVSPYVLNWIRRHSVRRVKEIEKTTAKIIRRQIIDGSKRGLSNAKIAANIRTATGGAIGRARAERIARTETHTAFERGSYEQAREVSQMGVDLVSEWASTEDRRTRIAHAIADGQVRDLKEPFIVDGEALRFPGDPRASPGNTINCRCVALYRPRKAGE